MTWGKVDDKLHAHRKVRRISSKARERLECLGLWVMCLSYSCDTLSDGFVDRELVAQYAGSDAAAQRLVGLLVAAGLWEPAEGGWIFHDWADYQPLRAAVEEDRADLSAKRAEAGRKGAASRWGRGAVLPSAGHSAPGENGAARIAEKSGNPDGKLPSVLPSEGRPPEWQTHGPVPIPTRSRPDPGEEDSFALTRSAPDHDNGARRKPRQPASTSAEQARGTRIPPDWQPSPDTLHWARSQGVDGQACVEEFREYWQTIPGAKGRRASWDLTFRGRIRRLIEQGHAPVAPQPEWQPSPPELPILPPADAARRAQAIIDDLVAAKSAKHLKGTSHGT